MSNFKTIVFMLIGLMLTLGCTLNKEKNTSFYVGTYTFANSKGIYKYQLSSKGKLSKIGLVATIDNPTFLVKSQDNKNLFAVSEVDNNGTGYVYSYQILKDSLLLNNKEKSGGGGPCFVTLNNDNYLLIANYGGGNVGLLKTNASGEILKLQSIQQHSGKGTTERQTTPHAHSTWFHPAKNEIISVDLGTNELWFSKIDKNSNRLMFNKPKTLQMAEGAGPRHLVFHPNNKWIYVLNELNNTVSLVKENNNGYFIETSIPTLPLGFKEYSHAADIHISKDGKFLYASNRGHESIVIYKVNTSNGHLKTVDYTSVKGKHPRNFTLCLNDDFLLVANQNTNNIVSFKRDEVSGKLTFIDEMAAPNPACLLF